MWLGEDLFVIRMGFGGFDVQVGSSGTREFEQAVFQWSDGAWCARDPGDLLCVCVEDEDEVHRVHGQEEERQPTRDGQ